MVVFSSCKKFLQEQTLSELTPKTAVALNELLLGEGYDFHPVASLLSDDDIEHFYENKQASVFHEFTWQSTTDKAGITRASYWRSWYRVIQMCNTMIEYTGKVSGTQEEKDYVKGQALLLRSYSYFNLVNLYALPYTDALTDPKINLGVPIVLKGGVLMEAMPRSSVADVYAQCINNVKEGTAILEKLQKQDGIGRINYIAGHLLASRIYLHMGRWQDCINSSTIVLNYKSVLMNLANWGATNPVAAPVVAGGNIESIWEFSSPAVYGFSADHTSYRLSESLVSSYEAGDLRSTVYMTGKTQRKTIGPNEYATGRTGQAFRVAEAYLNRAEASAHLFKSGDAGAASLALNDLNKLRKNRFNPADYQELAITDADELLELCRLEKRREFFREELHRWYDLKRYGMPSFQHTFWTSATSFNTYTLAERDNAYVREIPADALDLNDKLVPNPTIDPRLPD
jgi:starch-binding outer membrane protein, SusD/RagB family